MAKKSSVRQVKSVLKNADDIFHILTGRRLKNVVGTGINVLGDELTRKAVEFISGIGTQELPDSSPYSVLGIHREAIDPVVKAAYRALAKEYHPDTGTKPDPQKFHEATEAYNAIMAERQVKSEPSK